MSRPAAPADRPSHAGFLSTRAGHVTTAALVLFAILTAFIGSGALFGTPVAEAAGGWLDEDSTWIAPASGAFRIWSVIYVGLIAYAVWQFLPSADTDRHRAARPWILAGILLNSVWLWVVQAGWLAVSMIVIAVLVACLSRVLMLLERSAAAGRAEALLVDGTQGLYLGWVTIATITNVAAWLGSLGWEGNPPGPIVWTVIVIVAAAVIGSLLAIATRGRIAPALSLAWGLAWVAVARGGATVLESQAVVIAAAAAAGVILVVTAVCRLRR